jgi:hypothetical protein
MASKTYPHTIRRPVRRLIGINRKGNGSREGKNDKNGDKNGKENNLRKALHRYMLQHDKNYFPIPNILAEWQFIGGNKNFRYDLFKQHYPNKQLPLYQKYCICGKYMKENCYIEHIYRKTILVICNSCINEIIESDNSRRIIEDTTYNSSNDSSIDDNFHDISTTLSNEGNRYIDYGKLHNGRTYCYVLENHPDYCRWVLRQIEPCRGMATFVNWLKEIGFK